MKLHDVYTVMESPDVYSAKKTHRFRPLERAPKNLSMVGTGLTHSAKFPGKKRAASQEETVGPGP